MDDLRYPIGRPELRPALDADERRELIDVIEAAPARLRMAVDGLDDAQLDTPYRDGGWTVRQVVHHVPDSHMNGYIRFKWALTEDTPSIKVYEQADWAELHDARTMPIETSLALLATLHDRWVDLLRSMKPERFQRRYMHPEEGEVTLDAALQLYAWHGRHHTAHITALREREGW